MTTLAFSPGGRFLAVGSHDDKTLVVLEVQRAVEEDIHDNVAVSYNLTRAARCVGHAAGITSIDWSTDSKIIRSTSRAGEILHHDGVGGRLAVGDFRDASYAEWTSPLGFEVMGIWQGGALSGDDVNAVTVAATREFRCEMASKLRKSLWNSLLYSATNLPWFIPKISICRRCASDVQWHLNPFSSRHCFAQTWQYHRSFCKPLLFAAFAFQLFRDAHKLHVKERNDAEVHTLLGGEAPSTHGELLDAEETLQEEEEKSGGRGGEAERTWVGGITRTFALMFVAEWGDRSMFATMALATQQDGTCLVRLEVNQQAGMCRASVRSASSDLDAGVVKSLAGQLN